MAGRKPLWDELDMKNRLESIKGWAMNGSTDEEIYNALGISKDTFYRWKKEKSEFCDALKKGRFDSNGEILNSAYNQSVGYNYTEQQAIKIKVDQYEEEVRVIDIEKFAQPNPTMTIFMLKNRLPEQYKDKQNVEHSGETTQNVNMKQDLSKLSVKELKELESILSKTTDTE